MKSTTVLLVAFSFVAGVGVGFSGPLAKVGEGLARVISGELPALAHVDRITVSFENQRPAFQPADFRWSVQPAAKSDVVCAPKDGAAHQVVPGIQHL